MGQANLQLALPRRMIALPALRDAPSPHISGTGGWEMPCPRGLLISEPIPQNKAESPLSVPSAGASTGQVSVYFLSKNGAAPFNSQNDKNLQ